MKIIILAQTPPPYHGQAIMQKYLVDTEWDWCEKIHLRMDYSNEIDEIGKFKLSKIIALFKIVLRVWKERIKGQIDVIYYPPAGPNKIPFYRDIITLLLIRWTTKKIIFHFHAGGINKLLEKLNPVEKFFAGISLRNPDASIVLSKNYLSEVSWFQSKKIYVVQNGIEDVFLNFKPEIKKNGFIILTIGIISEEKGIYDILEIAKLFKEKNKNYYWIIAGNFISSKLERKCKEIVEKYNLEGNIKFLGKRTGDEKWKIFSEADLFLFLSHASEAQPLVLLEAMMFELPVIATNWRGIPEIINDGVNGFLVPVNDSETAADKVKLLYEDLDLRKKMGKQGRKIFLEKFTLEKHLNMLEKVFKETAFNNEQN